VFVRVFLRGGFCFRDGGFFRGAQECLSKVANRENGWRENFSARL